MKQFLILLIFALLIAFGFGVYVVWPQLDPHISKMYSESPEPEYFGGEEEAEAEPEPEDIPQFHMEASSEDYVALAQEAIQSDPRKSWEYLSKALEKDPGNQAVHIYKARMLEGAGKPSLAQEEYKLAYAVDPENLPFADQYAGFLMRRGHYEDAESLLRHNLKPPSNDSIWIKAWFLGKVYKPVDFNWKHRRLPGGHAKPLVRYILQLPPDRFWNDAEFAKVPYHRDYIQNQQITFWLKLFQALDDQDDALALQIIEENSFPHESWNPQLVINLNRILNYRLNRSLSLDPREPIFARLKKSAQKITSLTYELSELAEEEEINPNSTVPGPMRAVLLSDEIFTIALLDAKWTEGAIRLHKMDRYPAAFPKEYARDFALALKKRRGKLAAVKFAKAQQPSPELSLLIAEVDLELGDDQSAINQLHHLSKEKGEVGLKASRMIAQSYMRQNQYERARDYIQGNPHLKTDVAGQELLAQIFHEQKQPELAYRIYLAIEEESAQAKSYLAHKAIKEGDWDRAEELTVQLVGEFPNNKVYRRNLDIIRESRYQE